MKILSSRRPDTRGNRVGRLVHSSLDSVTPEVPQSQLRLYLGKRSGRWAQLSESTQAVRYEGGDEVDRREALGWRTLPTVSLSIATLVGLFRTMSYLVGQFLTMTSLCLL
jgi:hypothetical protein